MSDEQLRRVPSRVTKYHPALRQTVESLKSKSQSDGLMYSGGPGCVQLKLGPSQKGRALRILHVLFGEIERHGWELKPFGRRREELAIVKGRHTCPFSLKAVTRRVEVEKRKESWMPRFEFVPTGALRLELEGTWRIRGLFQDGVRKQLEGCIDDIVHSIAAHFEQCDVRDAERAAAEAERRARWDREQERRELAAIEAERDVVARQILTNWRDARDMRALVAQIRACPHDNDVQTDWLEWLDEWSKRVDPMSALPSDPHAPTKEQLLGRTNTFMP